MPFSPDGSKIAISVGTGNSNNLDRTREIYLVNVDSTAPQRLTDNDSQDEGPVFSPDGERIVFLSDRDDLSYTDIYVMNADGSNPVRLTESENWREYGAEFSPDGSKITFISGRDTGVNDRGKGKVYIMNADGTNQTQLTATQGFSGIARNPTFNHDGTRIAFATQRSASWGIYTINLDGTNEIRLTNSQSEDNEPSYSRDGSKIVFVSRRDSNSEIHLINSDGTNQTRLTNNAARGIEPVFTPDGTQIAFSSDRDGDRELYIMNADGTNVRRLTDTGGHNLEPSFAPQLDTDGDAWAMPVTMTSTRLLKPL